MDLQLTFHTTLTNYSQEKPITIEIDASKYSMGTELLEDGHLIAFTSNTLTNTKTRYTNVERECLSICFRLKYFHTFVYGRHVTFQNDHKCLKMIQHRPIHTAHLTYRECFFQFRNMTMQSIINLEKEMIIADRLSRFPSGKVNQLIPLHTHQLQRPVQQLLKHHMRIHRKRTIYHAIY